MESGPEVHASERSPTEATARAPQNNIETSLRPHAQLTSKKFLKSLLSPRSHGHATQRQAARHWKSMRPLTTRWFAVACSQSYSSFEGAVRGHYKIQEARVLSNAGRLESRTSSKQRQQRVTDTWPAPRICSWQ